MMRRRSIQGAKLAGIAVLGALSASPAQAQATDLTRSTCAQFNGLSGNEGTQLALWLHGYYAGAAQRPALDRKQLERAVNDFQAACRDNPELPLVGAESGALMRGLSPPPPAQPPPETPGAGPEIPAPSPLPGTAARPAPVR